MNETPAQNDGCSTWDLINIALTSDDEDFAYWDAVKELHRRGTTEVFEAARSLCESECPLEQRVGCGILAQLGTQERPLASESFPLVVSVMERTDDLDTLASALNAVGWFGDLRGVAYVLPFLDHPDSDVRYQVTCALTALNEDQRSIDGLIRLTSDSSAKVRDWATFGLGSLTEQDTPANREALVARLEDPDVIVRGEALVGLATRQDERVFEPLRQALEAGTYCSGDTAIDYGSEALEALKELDKCRQLMQWKTQSESDHILGPADGRSP